MDPGWPRTRAWLPRNNLVVPPNMELERTCDPATLLWSARPEEPVRDSNGHVQGGMFTIATGWKPPSVRQHGVSSSRDVTRRGYLQRRDTPREHCAK